MLLLQSQYCFFEDYHDKRLLHLTDCVAASKYYNDNWLEKSNAGRHNDPNESNNKGYVFSDQLFFRNAILFSESE